MTDYTNWREALTNQPSPTWDSTLCHHGIKGQEHGKRRFQYEDGSLTPAGRERYGVGEKRESGGLKNLFKSKKKKTSEMTDDELRKAVERNKLEEEYRKSKPASGLLSKGISLAKDLYEQHSKNKSEAAERKIKERELKYKENELRIRGDELKIRDKEAEAAKTKASAELTKSEADKLRANAEDNKWTYYTQTRKGRLDHMRQTKAEKLAAKAELKNAQAAKRAKNFLFGDAARSRGMLNKMLRDVPVLFGNVTDRKDALTAFFKANTNVTTSNTFIGNGKKK